jgi:hypothetical protein
MKVLVLFLFLIIICSSSLSSISIIGIGYHYHIESSLTDQEINWCRSPTYPELRERVLGDLDISIDDCESVWDSHEMCIVDGNGESTWRDNIEGEHECICPENIEHSATGHSIRCIP